uniref:TFIIA_gamma_N domain-containing protein n=1 Tax=Heterorhabditis bacteriophora TaxID=37862 RepID=A0A1I7W8T0_HETBA
MEINVDSYKENKQRCFRKSDALWTYALGQV